MSPHFSLILFYTFTTISNIRPSLDPNHTHPNSNHSLIFPSVHRHISNLKLVPTILPSFYSLIEILEDFHFKSLVETQHESTNANQISNISFSTDQITEERCVFSCFWHRRALSRPQPPTHSPSSHQIRRSMENRLMLLGSPSTLAPVALPPTARQTMRTNVPRFREPSLLAD